VVGAVETPDLGAGREARRRDRDPPVETLRLGLGEERALAVDTQRMTLREAVPRERLADQEDRLMRHVRIVDLSSAAQQVAHYGRQERQQWRRRARSPKGGPS
jgi:hypothetical protein